MGAEKSWAVQVDLDSSQVTTSYSIPACPSASTFSVKLEASHKACPTRITIRKPKPFVVLCPPVLRSCCIQSDCTGQGGSRRKQSGVDTGRAEAAADVGAFVASPRSTLGTSRATRLPLTPFPSVPVGDPPRSLGPPSWPWVSCLSLFPPPSPVHTEAPNSFQSVEEQSSCLLGPRAILEMALAETPAGDTRSSSGCQVKLVLAALTPASGL